MNVRLVASPGGLAGPNQYLITYLLNGTVAIDAGSLGFSLSRDHQRAVRHVFLSHSHIDHIASLPVFLEGRQKEPPPTVYASDAVLECLREDVFNGRMAPRLGGNGAAVLLQEIQSSQELEVDGLRITPIEVDHVVPTLGFIVADQCGAVVIASDTGPTEALWEAANRTDNVKAVFLEATFPNSMSWLSDVSKHMTPAKFADELTKLDSNPAVIAVHVKARFYDEVISELNGLDLPNLELAVPGKEYIF